MAEIIFNYEGNEIVIQCDIDEKIEDIINRFLIKANNNKTYNLVYLYNGQLINKELKFKEQENNVDNKRMKMDILVTKIEESPNCVKNIISKDVICPECKENIILNFEDYKINLQGCKNNHKYDSILLDKFGETQKITLNGIKCNICEINNKGITYNNEFYKCITCDKDICPLCRTKHDKEHLIINYDDKNYICKMLNESFIKYFKTCKEDICIICENEHKNHDMLDFSEIIINKNDLKKIMEDLKNNIDKFKYKLNIMKEIINKMNILIDIYYKINNEIINNYNINKRNYYHFPLSILPPTKDFRASHFIS